MGELEQALQFYETANDYYSLVRILCFNGQIARAIEVAEESGCKAAAYHLARRLSMESGVCAWRERERERERVDSRKRITHTYMYIFTTAGCEKSHTFLHQGTVL